MTNRWRTDNGQEIILLLRTLTMKGGHVHVANLVKYRSVV